MKRIMMTIPALACLLMPLETAAQTALTLEDCHRMAVENSRTLSQARTQVEMAGYDRKIALANYFPNLSVTGTYQYNDRDIALIGDAQSAALTNMGTAAQAALDGAFAAAGAQMGAAAQGAMSQLQTAIMTNPAMAAEYMGSPMWQTVLGMLQQMDFNGMAAPSIADPINAIGQSIDEALHPDLHNVYAGIVSVQQPVFMGGKIVYSNQMAALAEELARSRYDQEYADIIIDVDQAYWQIVSIAAKERLAESYAGLLHQLEHDIRVSVDEGVMTEADALQVKVKSNEADMLLTKSRNGLTLAKMLLCKRIGLPLDSEIVLADENTEVIPVPVKETGKDIESVYADRPETRSLSLASDIYEKKAKIARADLLPKVALTANYLVSNPNAFNGFSNSWNGGMFNAGVSVNIPLFHGFEATNKYRKAKAEATLYQDQYEDARELILLQVTQQERLFDEAREKLTMASSNLESAEENLRSATVGFEAGVIDSDTVMAAQTAWLQANSELIDAGTELQMAAANLRKANGDMNDNE
ncbi:MAG: TolC family protein [Bacteroidales bacterium]|nr:TolC family protein [Bacteroidales bacterium]